MMLFFYILAGSSLNAYLMMRHTSMLQMRHNQYQKTSYAESANLSSEQILTKLILQGIIEKYGLKPQSAGFFTGYDININAGVANSVGSTALAFVMSLLPNTINYFRGVSV